MQSAPMTLSPQMLERIRFAQSDTWPAAAFEILGEADILRWGVPEAYGGLDVTAEQMTAAYIDLADADLAACFVLTQRNSAVSRLAGSDNDAAKAALLPSLAAGDQFATVAISHLTTSRQHTSPAVRVTPVNDGYRLSGTCPWATSATRADVLVTGGQFDDGTQILCAVEVPSESGLVRPGEPMELHALGESETGTVALDDVTVRPDRVLAGPTEAVMSQGSGGGAGSLTTSALAIGLSQRAVRLLRGEAERRPDLDESLSPLAEELATLRSDVLAVAGGGREIASEAIRSRANSLALRSTQALLTATKGAGFVVGHPAERAVREAMFFLVWSCPRKVAAAAMAEFACLAGESPIG